VVYIPNNNRLNSRESFVMQKSSRIVRSSIAAVMAAFTGTAVASGLAIGTQSGSGTGNAFAGGAASSEDASTVWYNPAGKAPNSRLLRIS
jgi:long-subunit fatty acid transport protein